MAWLRLAVEGGPQRPVDHLLFVAPPSPTYVAAQPALTGFQPPDEVDKLIGPTSHAQPRLVCSNGDLYCEEGANQAYPRGFDVDIIHGAGHLDMSAGYGAWPSLLAWCSDPAVRITARPGRRPVAVP